MKTMRRFFFSTLIGFVVLCGSAFALTPVNNFGSNPGNLSMYKHVPAEMPQNAPLVLVLHGCTQSAASYDQDTGWSDLADRIKCYVVYAKGSDEYMGLFNIFTYTWLREVAPDYYEIGACE